jgi:surfeit locus 1 family protein
VNELPGRPLPTWRILLRGELLLLHLVACVSVAAMLFAAQWQVDVWRDSQAADRVAKAQRDPVPLPDVLGPDDALTAEADGAAVQVQGRWAPADDQFLLSGREPGGAWVVSPLLVDGTESAVLVVRGATEQDKLPPLSNGPVTVTGVLQPSESYDTAVATDRRIAAVNVSVLVSAVPFDLYSGYVVRTGQSPADPAALAPVTVALPDPSWTAGGRNLAYGLQWGVFAAFTAFMWWRIARDRVLDHRVLAEAAAADATSRASPRTPVA